MKIEFDFYEWLFYIISTALLSILKMNGYIDWSWELIIIFPVALYHFIKLVVYGFLIIVSAVSKYLNNERI
jgi:hypothetical protein